MKKLGKKNKLYNKEQFDKPLKKCFNADDFVNTECHTKILV